MDKFRHAFNYNFVFTIYYVVSTMNSEVCAVYAAKTKSIIFENPNKSLQYISIKCYCYLLRFIESAEVTGAANSSSNSDRSLHTLYTRFIHAVLS